MKHAKLRGSELPPKSQDQLTNAEPVVSNAFDKQIEQKSTRHVLLSKVGLRFDFRFSCDMQDRFACTLQHIVADRIGLLQSAPGPKVTTIINGLIPRQMRRERIIIFEKLRNCKTKQINRL